MKHNPQDFVVGSLAFSLRDARRQTETNFLSTSAVRARSCAWTPTVYSPVGCQLVMIGRYLHALMQNCFFFLICLSRVEGFVRTRNMTGTCRRGARRRHAYSSLRERLLQSHWWLRQAGLAGYEERTFVCAMAHFSDEAEERFRPQQPLGRHLLMAMPCDDSAAHASSATSLTPIERARRLSTGLSSPRRNKSIRWCAGRARLVAPPI